MRAKGFVTVVLLMLATLSVVSCGVGEDLDTAVADAGTSLATFRGELIWGHEARTFVECGAAAGEASWVVDETGEVWRIYDELTSEPYQHLFFEVRAERGPALETGFAADYADSLVIKEVRRAESEGHGCREDLTDLEFRAFGVEPFWSVEIRGLELTLRRPDAPEPLHWTLQRARQADGSILYTGTGQNGTTRLGIIETPCIDSMSGSRFPYTAQLHLPQETLLGCALAGDLVPGTPELRGHVAEFGE